MNRLYSSRRLAFWTWSLQNHEYNSAKAKSEVFIPSEGLFIEIIIKIIFTVRIFGIHVEILSWEIFDCYTKPLSFFFSLNLMLCNLLFTDFLPVDFQPQHKCCLYAANRIDVQAPVSTSFLIFRQNIVALDDMSAKIKSRQRSYSLCRFPTAFMDSLCSKFIVFPFFFVRSLDNVSWMQVVVLLRLIGLGGTRITGMQQRSSTLG